MKRFNLPVTLLAFVAIFVLLHKTSAADAPTTTQTEIEASLDPFWKSNRMVGESVLFVEAGPDKQIAASLMYVPTRIVRVVSTRGDITYEQGKDYVWTVGTRMLVRTKQSRIPMMTDAQTHPPKGSQKFGTCRNRNVDLLFVEQMEFQDAQVAVTYQHEPSNEKLPATLTANQPLPKLLARLRGKAPVSLVLLGDSISVGCNGSGWCNAAPHQPTYGQLVAGVLHNRFGSDITFKNLSVSGQNSGWGLAQVPAVLKENPDLLILAFGMNDASGGVPPAQLAATIRSTIDAVRAARPDCEFIVVTPMTGNPEWTGTRTDLYPQYRDALFELRGNGVAVADVTTPWLMLLDRKPYLDLTGNGLNHPNDFGYRVYAQSILSLFPEK